MTPRRAVIIFFHKHKFRDFTSRSSRSHQFFSTTFRDFTFTTFPDITPRRASIFFLTIKRRTNKFRDFTARRFSSSSFCTLSVASYTIGAVRTNWTRRSRSGRGSLRPAGYPGWPPHYGCDLEIRTVDKGHSDLYLSSQVPGARLFLPPSVRREVKGVSELLLGTFFRRSQFLADF